MGELGTDNVRLEGQMHKPCALKGNEYRFDAFADGQVLLGKKKNHLPAMGWNSWNAFGSGNTEALTRMIADRITELGLDRLGYSYVVLDDGCYLPERVEGRLANENVKFPSGFRALADYIHSKGLKFGMYNDIGTNLCAGAAVGTCGHEDDDALSYAEWDVDFLKVDNCYYLWDNATFSAAANVRYVFTPAIRSISLKGHSVFMELDAVKDGVLKGNGGIKDDGNGVTFLGTFDGTGPMFSPAGELSAELKFNVNVPEAGEYELTVCCRAERKDGIGGWLQVAVGEPEGILFYDDFVFGDDETKDGQWLDSAPITIRLRAGSNVIRLMNHRRQENTLSSYARLLEGLNKAKPGHDIIYSMCEWGKTQPHNWAYKVGDSWRILNDITFCVGRDGDPGRGSWKDDYTPSVTSQYNKAVIMDTYAGLDKGWNDPDMLMIGMNGLTENMNRTHMTMWCMMNSPLMLGLDLRRVEKDNFLWSVIANKDLIDLNQDPLGIQAKRIFSRMGNGTVADKPDTAYIRDINRVDVLAKPLADGSIALSFINVSEEAVAEPISIDMALICKYIGDRLPDSFKKADKFLMTELWSKETTQNTSGIFEVKRLEACDNVTYRIEAEA